VTPTYLISAAPPCIDAVHSPVQELRQKQSRETAPTAFVTRSRGFLSHGKLPGSLPAQPGDAVRYTIRL